VAAAPEASKKCNITREVIMKLIKRPTKEQIREWLAKRRRKHAPVPDIEQIRRQLGWTVSGSVEPCAAMPMS
jgi:L-amino acid N-acyltransferase YncA